MAHVTLEMSSKEERVPFPRMEGEVAALGWDGGERGLTLQTGAWAASLDVVDPSVLLTLLEPFLRALIFRHSENPQLGMATGQAHSCRIPS